MITKIALKNVLAAGLRTWLNTFILALTMIIIILLQGMYDGMMTQISKSRISEELGNGQYWHKNYDPFDPLTLQDSHAEIPNPLKDAVQKREAVPVLMISGSVYPRGRVLPAILKGIPANQTILQLPFDKLSTQSPEGTIAAMVGKRMARQTQLAEGDIITVQWRNSKGAFNAIDLIIVHIFESEVPAMDQGQIWLSLSDLQKMNLSPQHATIIISAKELDGEDLGGTWKSKVLRELLADTIELVKSKKAGGSIFYLMLIFLSMIAIFDTQALSIFKRRKEIGTLMALGMTNRAIAFTFTLEGLFHGIFAAVVTGVLGGPIFWYLQTYGYYIPVSAEQYGIPMSDHMIPDYSAGLIIQTVVIILILLTFISYLPARKITKLQPYEALRGKWS
ncbi:FtsX-like permease family protein [bacterium]|nr:FtsX-like permease family protein [bacterium]